MVLIFSSNSWQESKYILKCGTIPLTLLSNMYFAKQLDLWHHDILTSLENSSGQASSFVLVSDPMVVRTSMQPMRIFALLCVFMVLHVI